MSWVASLLAFYVTGTLWLDETIANKNIAYNQFCFYKLIGFCLIVNMEVNLSPILVSDANLFASHFLHCFHASSYFVATTSCVSADDWRVMGDHLAKKSEIVRHQFIGLTQQWIKRFVLSIRDNVKLLNFGNSNQEHTIRWRDSRICSCCQLLVEEHLFSSLHQNRGGLIQE